MARKEAVGAALSGGEATVRRREPGRDREAGLSARGGGQAAGQMVRDTR